jgi:hypothetical protein
MDLELDGRIDLAESLHEVVRKRVVVIDQQDHDALFSGSGGILESAQN